jgi:primosomal protein N' (replication factor Y) (superfamily II helicase)
VKLTVALPDRAAAEDAAAALATDLRERADTTGSDVRVFGPAPAFVARRAGRWRFHLVLRGQDPVALVGSSLGPPWSIDVDPESLI